MSYPMPCANICKRPWLKSTMEPNSSRWMSKMCHSLWCHSKYKCCRASLPSLMEWALIGRAEHLAAMLISNRIIGFEDLGNTDDFSTARLEYRLIETGTNRDHMSPHIRIGVISRPRAKGAGQPRSIFGFKERKKRESSDEETDYN